MVKRRKDTWWNEFFGKMDDHPVHTTQSHHPPKINVLPITFLQIILAAKCLVRHWSTSSSDNLCLPFCLILILWSQPRKLYNPTPPTTNFNYQRRHLHVGCRQLFIEFDTSESRIGSRYKVYFFLFQNLACTRNGFNFAVPLCTASAG